MSKKSDKKAKDEPKEDNERLSPSSFMRQLRPEYYSDTEDRVSYTLDRAVFEYFLESLTARNQHHDFEIFCRKLCERTICPHIRPNTGPEGGGDGKTDAESIPVAEEIATLSYVGNADGGKSIFAFAFSATKGWSEKVRKDVKSISDTKRKFDRIYFVTSQNAKASKRAEIEQELEKEYKIPVTILDRSWITEQIIDQNRLDLAHLYLGVGEEKTDSLRLGPTDYSRKQQLEELEKDIADPKAFKGMEHQRVTEALLAAKLSRNMELPRTETDGRFSRAVRLAEQDGDYRQKLEARYEQIWTAFWYFDDLAFVLENYDAFEAMAIGSTHYRNLEFLINILQLLFNSVIHEFASRDDCRLDKRTEKIRNALQGMANELDRPSHSLEARCALLLLRVNVAIVNKDRAELPAIWKGFSEALDSAEGLGEFPAMRLVELIELVGHAAGNDSEYNRLVEKLAVFVGKRESEGRSGTILLNRAKKLAEEDHIEVIRLAGRAAIRLTKKEYSSELTQALKLLAVAYRKAGLPWAARASSIFVAASHVIDAEENGEMPVGFIFTMETLTTISLYLGHLPDFLYAIQMLNGAAATLPLTDESKEVLEEQIRGYDLALGSLLLNASDDSLSKLEYLPELLEKLGLIGARVCLLYILGHEDTIISDGSVPEGESLNSLREMLSELASQSEAQKAASKLLLNDTPTTITAGILGIKFLITPQSVSDEEIYLAELTAASLEAFFATTLQQDIIPHADQFRIRVEISDKVSEPSFIADDLAASAELLWPADASPFSFGNQEKLHDLMRVVISNALSRNFLMDNPEALLKSLFEDDGVRERMSMIMAVGNSFMRFAQRRSNKLSDWGEHMKTRFEKRARPSIVHKVISETAPTPESMESHEITRERPPIKSHDDMQVQSIIDVPAWDKAGWHGTGFTALRPDYPPVLSILFKNEKAARVIFERWRERLGGVVDEKNEIHVAIIREYDPAHPKHYITQISSPQPKPDEMKTGKSVVLGSRCLEVTVTDNVNLERFLDHYKRIGAYYLAAGIVGADGERELIQELMIIKRELSVKRADEVKELDVEGMALRSAKRKNPA